MVSYDGNYFMVLYDGNYFMVLYDVNYFMVSSGGIKRNFTCW